MTVYHDGYDYMTYTGNHVLSPSYRILYGASDRSPLSFERMEEQNPLLISTVGNVIGIGHSSTVKGPNLDSYYLVYHTLLNTTPNRSMNIDRIIFNGKYMEIADLQRRHRKPHSFQTFTIALNPGHPLAVGR